MNTCTPSAGLSHRAAQAPKREKPKVARWVSSYGGSRPRIPSARLGLKLNVQDSFVTHTSGPASLAREPRLLTRRLRLTREEVEAAKPIKAYSRAGSASLLPYSIHPSSYRNLLDSRRRTDRCHPLTGAMSWNIRPLSVKCAANISLQ